MNEKPKSRPILMNASSMQAILDGRKTQTRRVVKPQPNRHRTNDGRLEVRGNKLWWAGLDHNSTKPFATCPYGVPGDLLWCRETWRQRGGDGNILEVVNVKVERVQDISEKDAKAEGARHIMPSTILHKFDKVPLMGYRAGFRQLWDSINASPKPVKKAGKIHHYISYPFDGEVCVEEYRGLPHYIQPNPHVWCGEFKVKSDD